MDWKMFVHYKEAIAKAIVNSKIYDHVKYKEGKTLLLSRILEEGF